MLNVKAAPWVPIKGIIEKRLLDQNLIKTEGEAKHQIIVMPKWRVIEIFSDIIPDNLTEDIKDYLLRFFPRSSNKLLDNFNKCSNIRAICFISSKRINLILENLKNCLIFNEIFFICYDNKTSKIPNLNFVSTTTLKEQLLEDIKLFEDKNLDLIFCSEYRLSFLKDKNIHFLNPLLTPPGFHLDFLYKHKEVMTSFLNLKERNYNLIIKYKWYLELFSPEKDVLMELLANCSKQELTKYFMIKKKLTPEECRVGYIKCWSGTYKEFALLYKIDPNDIIEFIDGKQNPVIVTKLINYLT